MILQNKYNESIQLKVLNEKQHLLAEQNEYNFDHPDAFDMELLVSCLQRLREGKKIEVPIYNYVTHSRESRTVSFIEQLHDSDDWLT